MENGSVSKSEQRRGLVTALMCYIIWGLLPIFWKMLDEVNPFEIIAQRIIWCFVCMLIISTLTHQYVTDLLKDKRAWRYLGPAAALVTVNWSIFIYAVSADHIVETSIGYYINPLFTILMGVIVFRERLTKLQLAALALCTIGVVYFTVKYGQFPWIAILLAVTFSIYSAIKKKGGYPAIPAIAFENVLMVGPAIAFAVIIAKTTGSHAFASDLGTSHGIYLTIMLIVAGILTALPLSLFSSAANLIPLSVIGFIQYLAPTLSLLVAVLMFGEPFTLAHKVCLGFIWVGLALISFESVRTERTKRQDAQGGTQE